MEIVVDEDDEDVETLRGRTDVLVLQNRLWVVVLESKRTTISVTTALPQTLAYMMSNPYPDKPVFGIVTNGDEIFFVKLIQQGTPVYDISRVFALLPLGNELYNVLQILKRIGEVIS